MGTHLIRVLARVEYLAIGGAFGTPEALSVRYLVVGGAEQRVSSSVQIVSGDNEALYMGSGFTRSTSSA